MIFWRLTQEFAHVSACQLEANERFVRRFVGATFILLAVYVMYQSIMDLWLQTRPSASILGLILAMLSLSIMPLLAWGKMKAAHHIGSKALRLEAKETIACSLLSFILLAGLSLNALFGWWWADPVAGMIMVPWLIKEGREGLRGKSCCGD
jgi:divalent metal cation (Fe/Co/Zn/Cd) transporter